MTAHGPAPAPEPALDVIDQLAGVQPGNATDALRRRRPVTRAQLQASSDALFAPVDDRAFPLAERLLVAAFATRLTGQDPTAQRYAVLARAADPARTELVLGEAAAAAFSGPFGAYTEAGLRAESSDGPRYRPGPAVTGVLGVRLAAALAHTQLLVSRPREASAAALDLLLAAGWSLDAIVTLSQLVSFLAFQQRVATGLRVLADAGVAADADRAADGGSDADPGGDARTQEEAA